MRDKMKFYVIIILSYTLYLGAASAGRRHGGRSTPTDGECEIEKLISAAEFDEMFMKRNDPKCESKGFYSYEAFLDAAKYFSKSGFATTGNITMRKRELAAFLAQTAKQTAGEIENTQQQKKGGDLTAPDGPEAWGYCHIKDRALDTNCKPDPQWPCAPGKRYYGRGPIQLAYNYNYGKAGKALGLNLLNNPDLVAKDPIISFKTAIWFWMTPQEKIPSCHDVIIDKWKPSDEDKAAKRIRGYGVITNIIDGGYECGHGADTEVVARIGFYHRSCGLLKINGGNENDFDCFFQTPFAYPTIGN